MNLLGQRPVSPEALGGVPISSEINHLYGNTATKLTKPAGATALVLIVESGTFRIKGGDYVSSLASTAPAASVGDGSGSIKLAVGSRTVLPGPSAVTLIGTGATDTLTYYWY